MDILIDLELDRSCQTWGGNTFVVKSREGDAVVAIDEVSSKHCLH